MHSNREECFLAFVFDLMEPERPRVDRAMLDFVMGRVFDPADFIMSPTAFVASIRHWREWWWRRFLRRKSSTPTGTPRASSSRVDLAARSQVRG